MFLTSPLRGVLTPLTALTAVLPKEAATGMAWKKDPNRLDVPRANISWVASTLLDFARKRPKLIEKSANFGVKVKRKLFEKNLKLKFNLKQSQGPLYCLF
jgi:hypothetical protein